MKLIPLALLATSLASVHASGVWMDSRGDVDATGLGGRHPLPSRPTSKSTATKEDFVNVLDYGAVGDNKTDNTAAFQAAIQDAASMDGIQVRSLHVIDAQQFAM